MRMEGKDGALKLPGTRSCPGLRRKNKVWSVRLCMGYAREIVDRGQNQLKVYLRRILFLDTSLAQH